jgi:hypothetical protein
VVSREVRHHLSLEFREIPEESIGANHTPDETAQIRSLVLAQERGQISDVVVSMVANALDELIV